MPGQKTARRQRIAIELCSRAWQAFPRLERESKRAGRNPIIAGPPKRGRPARGKILSLLDRLRDRQTETLRFLPDPHVPWSNNLAERDVRMMKVQQKISGGFRTETGATDFCRNRSYVSTLQKNHIDLFDGITQALKATDNAPASVSRFIRLKVTPLP